jgi:small subunit ribosomal protein S7
MPRRYKPAKRVPLPDPIFNDPEVTRFINRLMIQGKRSTAEKIFYGALEWLDGKTEDKPIDVFHKVLKRVKPLVRVKSRRVGGSTYQVPIEVREEEGVAIGSRWLILYARQRSGRTMLDKLANEFLDAYRGAGGAMRKREETHKMAEANKAFAHYRY